VQLRARGSGAFLHRVATDLAHERTILFVDEIQRCGPQQPVALVLAAQSASLTLIARKLSHAIAHIGSTTAQRPWWRVSRTATPALSELARAATYSSRLTIAWDDIDLAEPGVVRIVQSAAEGCARWGRI
jgi:replication-associated recombination protein RarA